MTTQLELLDDLRDRLNDATDTQIPLPTKTRFLNRGQSAMFPKVFQTARATTALVAGTFEYSLPVSCKKGKVLMIEVETGSATGRYRRAMRYEVIPSVTDPLILFEEAALPAAAGALIRVTAAIPMTPFTSNTADVYSGPDGTEELPVLYAMGLSVARALDDRMDYERYSVTNQIAGVEPADLMTASQFWFAQFELLLERHQVPLPTSFL